jgi:DNA-binding beta-propeller fold protein YncE
MHRISFTLLAASVAFAQSGYHQIKKFTIGGDGGWDYLIAEGGRVYVSHGNEIAVVDSKSGEVKTISDLHGVHGIALAPEFGRGFISNGRSNTVTIFDLSTLAKIGDEVATGKNPDAIMYDPASKRIFTFNGSSSDATAIDPKDGKVAGTIPLDGKPEFAAADGKGHVYVNIEDKSSVYDIDSKKLTVLHRWPLKPCEEPSGLAMDTKTRRIFSGCSNQMVAVMDADSGKVVATLPIGKGVDATAFDPGTNYVFNSCGQDAMLSVIHEDSPDKYSVVENVKTQAGARTMALDLQTHNVFLAIAEYEAAAPAAAVADGKAPPRARRKMAPGSFGLLEFGK